MTIAEFVSLQEEARQCVVDALLAEIERLNAEVKRLEAMEVNHDNKAGF